MEFKFYVGMLGTTFSLFLQVSPIPGMIEGFRKGDVKSMTIGYFITGITQASLWIGYGACLRDFFIYFPNVTCASLFLAYLNMLIYVKKKYHLYCKSSNYIAINYYFIILSRTFMRYISSCYMLVMTNN